MAGRRLKLLRRAGCGLCEDMARDLTRLGLAFDEVDIEQDAALEAAYGEAIPVVLWDGREVARAPQTDRTLRRVLARAGVIDAVP
jgi:hypothetical protein